jgi:hypothetical protein
MTDKSVDERTGKWAGRGRALPYRWYERWGDRRCATQDARAGVPALPAESAGIVAAPPSMSVAAPSPTTPGTGRPEQVWRTPHTLFLGQLGRSWAEREWIAFQSETAEVQVERAQAQTRRDTARAGLVAAEQQLEEHKPLSDTQLTAVAPGEEATSDGVRSGRRRREHAARRAALVDEIQRRRTALEKAEVELTELTDRIRIRREVAEVRVAMIEAYVRRRCSAYLTRLARKHPDGKRIGALVRSGWSEQPSWLRDDGLDRPGGA